MESPVGGQELPVERPRELPAGTGASVGSAAVCSEVIYLHGPISCKYWQRLGGGL